MELSLKMPKGKPPFIGIVFTSVREACSLNEELVNSPVDILYSLTFMHPTNNDVQVRIRSDNMKHFVIYKNVKCDPVQLENFIFINRMKQDFNFGHILRDFDRDTIVCTKEQYKPFVLKLQGVFVMA